MIRVLPGIRSEALGFCSQTLQPTFTDSIERFFHLHGSRLYSQEPWWLRKGIWESVESWTSRQEHWCPHMHGERPRRQYALHLIAAGYRYALRSLTPKKITCL